MNSLSFIIINKKVIIPLNAYEWNGYRPTNYKCLEKLEDIELEARFVAKKIRDLIDSKFQIYDIKKEKYRDICYKDIVILLRSTKNKANIFEKELIKNDINVYSFLFFSLLAYSIAFVST